MTHVASENGRFALGLLASRPSPSPLRMLAQLRTFSLLGIEAGRSMSRWMFRPALPKTVLVGLPEAAVKESTHRVERALVNSGFQRPQDRS